MSGKVGQQVVRNNSQPHKIIAHSIDRMIPILTAQFGTAHSPQFKQYNRLASPIPIKK
jgi:hypothetical protein